VGTVVTDIVKSDYNRIFSTSKGAGFQSALFCWRKFCPDFFSARRIIHYLCNTDFVNFLPKIIAPIMNNLFRRFLLVAALLPMALVGFCWGQKGHDVTVHIAERHLTPAAQAAVDSLFDGRSPVYWANWLDNASHTADYAYTKTWHYLNVDADKSYSTMPKNPNGDIVSGIRYSIRVLADSAQTRENRALALKMLVHFLGDLHQPLHMGHATDLGGNTVKVKYFGRDTNLHTVWDTNLVESAHNWSYTEWADQLDRLPLAQQLLLLSGNVDDWAQKSLLTTADVYAAIPAGTNLSYNDVARWAPVIEDALLTGGLRLAHILNSLFDPTYAYRRLPASF
jgi:hypothetical protein